MPRMSARERTARHLYDLNRKDFGVKESVLLVANQMDETTEEVRRLIGLKPEACIGACARSCENGALCPAGMCARRADP